MEMKPLNGDQKGIEAAQGEQADTAAGVDATVVVLDGSQKRYTFFSGLLIPLLASSPLSDLG